MALQKAPALRLAVLPILLLGLFLAPRAEAQTAGEGTTIVVGDPTFKPLPIAIADFLAPAGLAGQAETVQSIVAADLERSGLFQIVPESAHVGQVTDFNAVPTYADWRAIDVQALVTGQVQQGADGRLVVQYRLFDTQAGEQLVGRQIMAGMSDVRRIGHKIADGVYVPLTGEGPYFDSRIAFVAESGSKGDRQKRIAIMDVDGANVRYLTGPGLVLGPRFSPDGERILYTSYETGRPELYMVDVTSGQSRQLGTFPGMTFAPQFSPSGNKVVFSVASGGNTDIWEMNLASGQKRQLTQGGSIETSPDYSPDGSRIVFESDRAGSQQLYIMPASGGSAHRISFGSGSYASPVWAPTGDLIAFTKIQGGRFHIGVMRPDGSGERLLSTSFLDEGPTFSPNGRVLMFSRSTPGVNGSSSLVSVDVTGRNLRRVQTPGAASDPDWSPLRK